MDILLEETVVLQPEQTRTNVLLPFALSKSYGQMEIFYSYSPKKITDPAEVKILAEQCLSKYLLPEDVPQTVDPEQYPMGNLVTISLDKGEEFVGAAHRQAPEQHHILSPSFSSPGFRKTEITKGDWRLMINIHALGLQPVTCQVKIVGKEASDL